eukprot:scaffold42387_cov32-Phaeocystis_antarctica.AAC.1
MTRTGTGAGAGATRTAATRTAATGGGGGGGGIAAAGKPPVAAISVAYELLLVTPCELELTVEGAAGGAKSPRGMPKSANVAAGSCSDGGGGGSGCGCCGFGSAAVAAASATAAAMVAWSRPASSSAIMSSTTPRDTPASLQPFSTSIAW